MPGVSIALQGGSIRTIVTDVNGKYSFAGVRPGAYVVAPTSTGLFYSPASQSVNITTASATVGNFLALTTPIAIVSLTLSPFDTIASGATTNAIVTLNQPAPPGGIVVNLTSELTKPAKFSTTVTVPAGQTSGAYTVSATGVSNPIRETLIATYQGPLASQPSQAIVIVTIAPTDSVRITSATYSKGTQVLQVAATSTNPQAILTVSLASNGQTLGTMNNLGGGNYSLSVPSFGGIPSSVNVTSNLAGKSGQGVKVNP
jgi:hypothetical protein